MKYCKRNFHIRKTVWIIPFCSQRRLEVRSLDLLMQSGRVIFRKRLLISMSSIRGMSLKPEILKNIFLQINIPWSPVDTPLKHERKFIIDSMILKYQCEPESLTLNRPQNFCELLRALEINRSMLSGARVSACKKHNTSPAAWFAPAFICMARPGLESMR